jgi:hypothetical protein
MLSSKLAVKELGTKLLAKEALEANKKRKIIFMDFLD